MSTKADKLSLLIRVIFIFYTAAILRIHCFDNSKNYGFGKMKYCNPKYVQNCSVVSYSKIIENQVHTLTNYSFTPLVAVANNVSITGLFHSKNGISFKVEHKFCDYFRQPWLELYFKNFFKDRIPCPMYPGKYDWNNLELPPRNFPVPMKPGIYEIEGELFQTVSKERIMAVHYTINFARKQKAKRKG